MNAASKFLNNLNDKLKLKKAKSVYNSKKPQLLKDVLEARVLIETHNPCETVDTIKIDPSFLLSKEEIS